MVKFSLKKIVLTSFSVLSILSLSYGALTYVNKNSTPNYSTTLDIDFQSTLIPESIEEQPLQESPSPIVNYETLIDSSQLGKEFVKACEKGKTCLSALINYDEFENITNTTWLDDSDRVFIYKSKENIYVFPEGFLSWHNLLSITLEETPLIIIYSPLTAIGKVYESKINEKIANFNTTEYFYKSAITLFDNIEGNIWSSISGKALLGPAATRGESLKGKPLSNITFLEAKSSFPNALVITRNTKYSYNYKKNAYEEFLKSNTIYFSRTQYEGRLPAKTVVHGFEILGKSYIIKDSDLPKNGETREIPLSFNNTFVSLQRIDNIPSVRHPFLGTILLTRAFWYAWLAHYPDSQLLTPLQ